MNLQTAPFKFLDSYKQEDKDIFFGREKETAALYNALSGVKHLLVYGPSGAGKTSLVECGLRNQFSDADWFALTIRRGGNMTASVFSEINEKLRNKMDLQPGTLLPADPKTDFGQAIENLFAERYQPVYLLFDQFEELLISGEDEEKRDFFTRLHRLIRYKVPCRVMLIMREEFIGHLSEFEPLCPSIFQHRFRLEKMRKEHVREVIRQTLEAPQYSPYFSVDNPEQLADSILAKLPDERREIELAHVQVFLSELWDRANESKKANALPLLHQDLIKPGDNLEGVLDRFLKNQLGELEKTYGEKAPLEVLACMISERHTKLQVSEGELQKELDGKEVELKSPLRNLLRDLEQRRILRTVKAGEERQFEISHDVLALVVGYNRTDEMKRREDAARIYRLYEKGKGVISQEALNELRFYEKYKTFSEGLEKRVGESEAFWEAEKVEELERTRKRLRTVRGLLAAAGCGFLIAMILGVWAWQQNIALTKKEAINQRIIHAFQNNDERFQLIFENEVYRYISKSTQRKIENGRFEEAYPFDRTIGLAKVRETEYYLIATPDNKHWAKKVRENKYYLIDTLGNKYLLAENMDSLSSETGVLDLRFLQLSNIPSGVFDYPNLKILLLGEQITSMSQNIRELDNFSVLTIGDRISILPEPGNQLTVLPTEVGNLANLKTLYLGNNKLTNLPAGVGNLVNLERLDLCGNQLTALPPEVGKLVNLEWLDLSGNQLTALPPEVGELANLQVLALSENRLITMPAGVRKLAKLKRLNLWGNQLTTLPAEVGNLTNLQFLDLEHNKLTVLPAEVGNLTNLQFLNLQDNKLTVLPAEVGNLINLQFLNLQYNKLTVLPAEVGNLTNLQILDLGHNQLSILASEVGNLAKLEALDLSDNQLSALPAKVWELAKLQVLGFSGNQLTTLPTEVGKLANLQDLSLSDNQLSALPAKVWELAKLQVLGLSGNQLTTLPAEVGNLINLRDLSLGNNQLTTLPAEVGNLINLRDLSLENNKLTSLPAEVGNLINLRDLYLENNKLTSLPAEVGKLTNLQDLWLRENKLTSLPVEMGKLANLKLLDLRGNPIPETEQRKIRQLLPWCEIHF